MQTPISGKQKRHLRGLGQKLEPVVRLGREAPGDNTVAMLVTHFHHHDLLKVKLAAGGGRERSEAAEDLARLAGAACVGVVGRTALLYCPDHLAPDDRTPLP